jgi:hypothetical protein
MVETIEPKPEFRSLAEDVVIAALHDPDPANPVAIEVGRLIDAYTKNIGISLLIDACNRNFNPQIPQLEGLPGNILRMEPRWPIEGVAMRLTKEAILTADNELEGAH